MLLQNLVFFICVVQFSYGQDDYDMFSLSSTYLSKLNLGVSVDIYDDGELLKEMEELKKNPDIKLNVTELIQKYGFPVETHHAYTKDDYVLTLHRIPHGKQISQETGSVRPIAFIQHGMCSSSVDWIMHTPDKALPYMLAQSGFDVWLGNFRGNQYSKRHITMTSKRSKFWDFSWDEIGKHDVPTMIDYILKTTKQKELNYIGHSMGTTAFFVAMSSHPEYNRKIKNMVALGPAVHMEEMKSPLRYLARFSNFEKFIFDLFGNGEIIPDSLLKYVHRFAPSVCNPSDPFTSEICDNIMYAIGGFNLDQQNLTQMPVILSHTPSSCSTKSGIHYLQNVSSKKFRQYDYGFMGNLKKYNQLSPPEYNLNKVSAPVTMFWAENDVLCDPKGVKRLEKELPNLTASYKVNNTKFTHIDYLFAKDADKLIYMDIVSLLKKDK